jgi:glyoxylase-like metal-dependent hydrolase (beta-lactamase superfamily II)/8-oxo-dGTP pyrophosphatase MutT (NUDIX family)
MAFAPDMHVFPGGAVDPGDADPALAARSPLSSEQAAARLGVDIPPTEALAFHMAAIRELFEEAGVLLADPAGATPSGMQLEDARASLLAGRATFGEVCRTLDLRPRPDLLAPMSQWVTPRVVPRRFDVRFFAAELPQRAEPSFPASEVVAHAWMTPSDALQARAAGQLGLWVPTSATLQQLEHVRDFAEIAERLAPAPGQPFRAVDEAPGLVRLILPAAGGVAGQPVNSYAVGHAALVVIDPGDPSESVLDELIDLATRRGGEIRGVAITHADPDHHAGAEAIALTLDVPIFGGPGSSRAVPYEISELADAERITVGDLELTAIHTPGHRVDHVAYHAPAGWTLTGDLLGPGPARSILGARDRGAWRASLDRLGGLGIDRVFPGHGEPPADLEGAIDEARSRLTA